MKKQVINEMGNVYGKLTVIERGADEVIIRPNGRKDRRIKWNCQCSCGKTTSVRGVALRNGTTKSCGCYTVERSKQRFSKPGYAGFNTAVSGMQGNARKRNIPWEIDDQQALLVMSQNCAYCGTPPSNVSKATSGNFVYSGIDRMDNTKGYIAGNIIPCCKICNHAKSDLPMSAFVAWLHRARDFQIKNYAIDGSFVGKKVEE